MTVLSWENQQISHILDRFWRFWCFGLAGKVCQQGVSSPATASSGKGEPATAAASSRGELETGTDLAWGLGVRQPPLRACTSRKNRGGMRGRRREERRRGGAGGGRRMSPPPSMNLGSATGYRRWIQHLGAFLGFHWLPKRSKKKLLHFHFCSVIVLQMVDMPVERLDSMGIRWWFTCNFSSFRCYCKEGQKGRGVISQPV